MIRCGLDIECHHHEVATGGQCEIDQRFDTLVKSADNMMLYKYVIRNVAYQYGKTRHLHAQAAVTATTAAACTRIRACGRTGKPLFAGDCYAGLSQMALWYIGGLLKHARALSAIIAPTTNSYKRLVPGYEAPVNLAYSRRNRSAAVPHSDVFGQSQGQARRVPPARSVVAIRYMAFAAMLMAGLDGVMNKIDPGEPLDKDIYDLSPEEMKKVPSMPASLEEALSVSGRRPRLPAQGRRLHRGAARDLHQLQAPHRSRCHPSAPASVRIRALLRHLDCPRSARRSKDAAKRRRGLPSRVSLSEFPLLHAGAVPHRDLHRDAGAGGGLADLFADASPARSRLGRTGAIRARRAALSDCRPHRRPCPAPTHYLHLLRGLFHLFGAVPHACDPRYRDGVADLRGAAHQWRSSSFQRSGRSSVHAASGDSRGIFRTRSPGARRYFRLRRFSARPWAE